MYSNVNCFLLLLTLCFWCFFYIRSFWNLEKVKKLKFTLFLIAFLILIKCSPHFLSFTILKWNLFIWYIDIFKKFFYNFFAILLTCSFIKFVKFLDFLIVKCFTIVLYFLFFNLLDVFSKSGLRLKYFFQMTYNINLCLKLKKKIIEIYI